MYNFIYPTLDFEIIVLLRILIKELGFKTQNSQTLIEKDFKFQFLSEDYQNIVRKIGIKNDFDLDGLNDFKLKKS